MSADGRILFVDDDPQALEAIRRQMPALGDRWQAGFQDSAAKGLQAFAEAPFQVVVADLDMPGMTGVEFLQEIMARHPGTIRLLAAAETDGARAMHSVGRVHQFLVKPVDLAFLKSALDFSTRHGLLVGNEHVHELIARIGQLPAVPELYRELCALLESERGSAEQLGAVIGRDIAMTAMLLKLANSAFFSLRQEVTSPAEAASYLGADLIRGLVLAHGLFGQVGSFRIPGFTLQQLWQHSLTVAASARCIAQAEGSGAQRSSACFTAGLLHDIGILILASRFPEDYARVLETNRRCGGNLEGSEYHVFGTTHAEVGAYLLALWGLPEPVVQAAAHHHGIHLQDERSFTTAVAVHVADALYADQPDHVIFSKASLDETYLANLGLLRRLPEWLHAIRAADAGPGQDR